MYIILLLRSNIDFYLPVNWAHFNEIEGKPNVSFQDEIRFDLRGMLREIHIIFNFRSLEIKCISFCKLKRSMWRFKPMFDLTWHARRLSHHFFSFSFLFFFLFFFFFLISFWPIEMKWSTLLSQPYLHLLLLYFPTDYRVRSWGSVIDWRKIVSDSEMLMLVGIGDFLRWVGRIFILR